MIAETHRPEDLQTALRLLRRDQPPTIAMGGGFLLHQAGDISLALVDLAALELQDIQRRGRFLELGAATPLADLLGLQDVPRPFRQAVVLEAAGAPTQGGTLAGTVVGSDGRSSLAAMLLAMDAQIQLAGEEAPLDLGNLLHSRRYFHLLPALPGRLITGIRVNLDVDLFFEAAPQEKGRPPKLILAAARWSSGRTRLVVAGWGRVARLALDAPEGGGLEPAVSSALAEAGDEAMSAATRRQLALQMADRARRTLEPKS